MPLFCIFTATTAATQPSFIVWKKTPDKCVGECWLCMQKYLWETNISNMPLQGQTRMKWCEEIYEAVSLSFSLLIQGGKNSPTWPCIWMPLNDYLDSRGSRLGEASCFYNTKGLFGFRITAVHNQYHSGQSEFAGKKEQSSKTQPCTERRAAAQVFKISSW